MMTKIIKIKALSEKLNDSQQVKFLNEDLLSFLRQHAREER